MYKKTYFTLNLLLLLSSLISSRVSAEFIATISVCPSGTQRINNGCYSFYSTLMSWSQANNFCLNITDNTTYISHLLSFEILAESISMLYWLKGNGYTYPMWIDGIMIEGVRTIYWNDQPYESFGYIKDTGLGLQNATFMRLNSSNQYEIQDSVGTVKMGYICETQVKCFPVDNVCLNNGTCYVNAGRVLCVCPQGFTGPICEFAIDNCESNPCKNGATCQSSTISYTCHCGADFTDDKCSTIIPWKYEKERSLVLGLFSGLVGLIILLLCLMSFTSMPWHILFSKLKEKKKNKGTETSKQSTNEPTTKTDKESDMNTFSKINVKLMVNSEEEMLKRFQMAMKRSKNQTSLNISPAKCTTQL